MKARALFLCILFVFCAYFLNEQTSKADDCQNCNATTVTRSVTIAPRIQLRPYDNGMYTYPANYNPSATQQNNYVGSYPLTTPVPICFPRTVRTYYKNAMYGF